MLPLLLQIRVLIASDGLGLIASDGLGKRSDTAGPSSF